MYQLIDLGLLVKLHALLLILTLKKTKSAKNLPVLGSIQNVDCLLNGEDIRVKFKPPFVRSVQALICNLNFE